MDFWQSFWSIIWWFVCAFVFISYLMVLVGIVADIFRDKDLSGWLKALWVLLLVFIPFITALVYLIFRGRGMASRSSETLHGQQAAADAYIRQVAGTSPSDEIERAARLRDAGTIRPDEFERIKARALA